LNRLTDVSSPSRSRLHLITVLLLAALLLAACRPDAPSREAPPTGTLTSADAIALTAAAAPTSTPTSRPDPTPSPAASLADSTPTQPPLPSPTPTQIVPATRIMIPKLDLDKELIEAPIVDGQWDVTFFRYDVAHLEGTAYPGMPGNAVLAAHRQHRLGNGPFLYLSTMAPGDLIYAVGPGVTYIYEVEWVEEVEPTDIEVTFPTEQPSLTLITCDTWDWINRTFLKRLVVRAVLVESQWE
jgi:sortase A